MNLRPFFGLAETLSKNKQTRTATTKNSPTKVAWCFILVEDWVVFKFTVFKEEESFMMPSIVEWYIPKNNENIFGGEVGTMINCVWMRAKSIYLSIIYFILNSRGLGLVLPVAFNRLGGFRYYNLNHNVFTIILANSFWAWTQLPGVWLVLGLVYEILESCFSELYLLSLPPWILCLKTICFGRSGRWNKVYSLLILGMLRSLISRLLLLPHPIHPHSPLPLLPPRPMCFVFFGTWSHSGGNKTKPGMNVIVLFEGGHGSGEDLMFKIKWSWGCCSTVDYLTCANFWVWPSITYWRRKK